MIHVQPISYLCSPSLPSPRPPAGACDTQCHIFGPRAVFPFAERLVAVPHDAGKEELFAPHTRMGIERGVIVQSVTHGFDNAGVIGAIAARPGAYRGVALLPTSVADAELQRLDAAGFCAIRFNFIIGYLDDVAPIADVVALSRRLVDLGWHLQV